ncbi:MAG: alpha/beta hydrolase, partial [Candidatus Dormibacteraceae bacterium]
EHLDSNDVARDIDSIRKALGETKLNWLGLSYGTMLGTAYAEHFPNHIRAMALDGAMDHSLSETAMLATEAATAEDGFNRFSGWCSTDKTCALHGEKVGDVYDQLINRANRTPIRTPDPHRSVSGDEIQHNTQGMLGPGISGWPALARAIKQADAGDASAFVTGPSSGQSFRYSAWSISCLEFGGESATYGDISTRELLARNVAPHLGGAVQTWDSVADCIGWPAPQTNPAHPLVFHDLPPILIVNANHDPSTSYVWAQGLAAQMPGSTLLTREGDGHTSYNTPGCARTAIEHYLIDFALPPPATTCPN